ncbi:hypothetical protein N5923_11915 [Erwiniaceae bacterium BAC15a-03b]|uniref:Uncharacterized protein n=1 Tax=Winslowiella arboricola TaxID=2978220 RepID=A0A9J6PTW8_9GAMM|nr:hypothetical protein [Winslowiella arboricola]MCU5771447.1 hypothetical protein [Winslowiella arboricola]MCU5778196.1 hypothetical protein [Winslowiella arboricola]
MDAGLNGNDFLQISVLISGQTSSLIDTHLALRKQLTPTGQMTRDAINSSTEGYYAFRPGEPWTTWHERLHDIPGITQNDINCITGLTPEMLPKYLLQP